MPIRFDAQATGFVRTRGMDSLPESAKKRMDRDGSGTVSLQEAAGIGTRARLDGDGQLDAQERARLGRLLGVAIPPASNTTSPSQPTTSRPTTRPSQPTNGRSSTERRPGAHPTTPDARSTAPGPSARRSTGSFQLSEALLARHDDYDREKLEDWTALINDNRDRPIDEKLHKANAFFNTRMIYARDQQAWGTRDYWATPVESLAKGGGDCDDFAIAKYATLRNMGVPKDELKLAYVYLHRPGREREAHMVLMHQEPGGKATVLDNFNRSLETVADRDDLKAVFTFNEDAMWLSRGDDWSARMSGAFDRLSKWQSALGRMRREGVF